MQRVTITIDDDLDAELERFMSTRGYDNRSEAIRDLARSGLQQAAMEISGPRPCVAALVYVYDHEARELPKRLTRDFHKHHDLAQATLHVHLDEESCMEVTVLKGHGIRCAALCRSHHCRARRASWARRLFAGGQEDPFTHRHSASYSFFEATASSAFLARSQANLEAKGEPPGTITTKVSARSSPMPLPLLRPRLALPASFDGQRNLRRIESSRVVGAEADVTFPGFPNNAGISIGGITNLASPTLGAETFSETVLTSGTVRGRIGYAPGSWLFYATGGFAWTYNQLSLTQLANGATESPFLWRLGFAAGAGFEVPSRVTLDCAARISVHRLWQQQHDILGRRPADRFQLRSARAAGRLELSVRQRCAAGTDDGQSGGCPRS